MENSTQHQQSRPSSREGSAEIEAIEAAKENVLPLRTGRSASKLTGLLSRDRKSVETELKAGHDQFKAEIAAVEADLDNADDPLDVYHRYIRWTLQSYPSGPSHASHLVPLLEQTTRRFTTFKQYKSDIRYLRLWILYSKYIDTPRDIFRFLEANDIGTSSASLYEEWATIEEGNRQFKEAEAIWMLGVHRRAEPLGRLKRRKNDFLTRMLTQPMAGQDEPLAPTPASTLRPALGGSGSQRQGLPGGSSSAGPKANGAAFAVFTDSQAVSTGPDAREGQPWAEIGTRDARRRENVKEATPWAGETQPMNKAQPQGEKLMVFRDEDCAAPSAVTPTTAPEPVKSLRGPSEADSLKSNPFKNYDNAELSFPSAEGSSISETLAKLQKPAAPSQSKQSSSHKGSSSTSSAKAKSASSSSATAKKERVASPLAEVYPEDELGKSEYSFEEILAIRRGLRSRDGTAQQQQIWAPQHQPEWLLQAAVEHEPFHSTSDGHAVLYDAQGRGTFAYLRQRQDEEAAAAEAKLRQQKAEAQADEDRLEAERARKSLQSRRKSRAREATPEQASPARHAPSPTINTKAAMAEVDDMFGSTMAFDVSPRSSRSAASSRGRANSDSDTEGLAQEAVDDGDSRTENSSSDDEEHQPVPSQASHPGDFVNDSFWGPVQSQASQFSQPSQSTARNPRNQLMDEGDESAEDEEDTPPAQPRIAQRLFTIPSDADGYTDENAAPSRARPTSKRSGLGAKPLPLSTPSSDSEGDGFPSQVISNSKLEVFKDEEENPKASAQPSASDLGRRPLGEASRFAPMVTLMTPIVERTMEYGNQTQTSYLTGDLQGARPLVEDSEPEDEAEADRFSVSSSDQGQQRKRKASTASTLASVHEAEDSATEEEDEDQELVAVLDSAAHEKASYEPVCPFTAEEMYRSLRTQKPALSALRGYHDLMSQHSDRLPILRKEARSKGRKSASQDEAGVLLELDQDTSFSVREKLGEGGFGAVFRVASTKDVEGRPAVYALKTQRPAVSWEFKQIHQLRSRLASDSRALTSIIQPFDLFHFADESHLLLEVCDQGTLLDMVNVAPSSAFGPVGGAPGLDELLAMFFTTELLRVMEAFHQVGMLHGDFKIDNCLVRLDEVPGGPRAWSAQYKSDGSDGWAHKGVKVIDFGRAVDRQMYAEDQIFVADWKPDSKDCLEVRQGRSWTTEPDYYGLAGIAFTLLFGKHFEAAHTVETADGQGSTLAGKPFRRYHQVELWTRLFNLLLNPRSVQDGGSAEHELKAVRQDMEAWLETHGSKAGKNLKSLLKKVEIAQLSRGR